jgi:hypothetical protein
MLVFAAGNDEHLVGADLGVTAGPDAAEDKDDEEHRAKAGDDLHGGGQFEQTSG